ncbi:hypothetical protein M8J77_010737 [Diaphorina citri]|nr:hypothetical protein M8J77_010737 [Diaphorina citri]
MGVYVYQKKMLRGHTITPHTLVMFPDAAWNFSVMVFVISAINRPEQHISDLKKTFRILDFSREIRVDWKTSHALRHAPFVKGLGLPCH